MRTHARRFRSIFHRHPALPPRPALPPDPEPVVRCAPDVGPSAAPSARVKAWVRFGAHTLLAAIWVVLPQFVGARGGRDGEPLVVEVERACSCERAAGKGGPSLRDSLVPKDDAASAGDEAEGFVSPTPARAQRPSGAARGACEGARGPAGRGE